MVNKSITHPHSSTAQRKKQVRIDYRWLVKYAKPVKLWIFLSIMIGLFSGVLLIVQAGMIATLISMAARRIISTLPYSFFWGLLTVIIGRSVLELKSFVVF